MKKILIVLTTLILALPSCKKTNPAKTSDSDTFDGASSGKIKAIEGNGWTFKYTKDGLLASYVYHEGGTIFVTNNLTWETSQVTSKSSDLGYSVIWQRDSAGYALPSGLSSWTYDAEHHITSFEGSYYYWSNENLDSIISGNLVHIYQHTPDIDTRDMGARFIPGLPHLPSISLSLGETRLVSKIALLSVSSRDTTSIRYFAYEHDSMGNVTKETITLQENDTTVVYSVLDYTYYE